MTAYRHLINFVFIAGGIQIIASDVDVDERQSSVVQVVTRGAVQAAKLAQAPKGSPAVQNLESGTPEKIQDNSILLSIIASIANKESEGSIESQKLTHASQVKIVAKYNNKVYSSTFTRHSDVLLDKSVLTEPSAVSLVILNMNLTDIEKWQFDQIVHGMSCGVITSKNGMLTISLMDSNV